MESRDGHNWESHRDRLRDKLGRIFPGEQVFVYEWLFGAGLASAILCT